MPNNVEIKAKIFEFDRQLEIAKSISTMAPEEIIQKDIFFNVKEGRLKLRVISEDRAELIFYTRPDEHGPKLSDYEIVETTDPDGLENILKRCYGIRNVVEKSRLLLMSGRTRIHFDTVDKLGEFIELEVVLEEHEAYEDGEDEAISLMKTLEIDKAQLINVAYVDLLETNSA